MIAAVLALVLFFSYVLLPDSHSPPRKSTYSSPASITTTEAASPATDLHGFVLAPSPAPNQLLHGATIMPKLGNETIKYLPSLPPSLPLSLSL